MARIIWTEPAIADLDAIADYIAIDNPSAARAMMSRVFDHVGQLAEQPESGSRPSELGPRSRYRQLIEHPCRIFYRYEAAKKRLFVLYVMRGERMLRRGQVSGRDQKTRRA